MTTVAVVNFSHHKAGNRAFIRFTLGGGEPVDDRIYGEDNEVTALAAAVLMIPGIDLDIQERDAERADRVDSDIADSGTATKKQVAIQRIRSFVEAKDPIIALRKIRKIIAFFVSEGWTAPKVKTQLNITSAQWTVITTKRDYLLANQGTIDAFEVVQNGVPE